MIDTAPQTIDDARYLALKARDARFDGRFFTGVTSTGIYCRPVCSVRAPKRENCRFFGHAALAEKAGFRPCLRCRPELAPGTAHASASNGLKPWSMQDASAILAQQAAQLLDRPQDWATATPGASALAKKLGISDRHLRRIFEAAYGVSPLQYLQTRRLLCAKQLLADTCLPVQQIARMSGFASVRRFNAALLAQYGLSPTQMRRVVARPGLATGQTDIRVRLGYRPPYDVEAMLRFFQTRQIGGLEVVTLSPRQRSVARVCRIEQGQTAAKGWVRASFDAERCQLQLEVSESLAGALPQVISAVRAMLDVDADPVAINASLHDHFPSGDGLRVPGTLDGFELAVRAILGQQITVAAARTLGSRLVERFGEPIATPIPGLTRLFPDAVTLAKCSGDELGQLGIVRQRQRAIQALASAVANGTLHLHSGADLQQTLAHLLSLPGVGDWTAQYIAMRALNWPDAFPAGDVALQKAMGVRTQAKPAQAALAASSTWQPWRSYAVIRVWAGLQASDVAGSAGGETSARRATGPAAANPSEGAHP